MQHLFTGGVHALSRKVGQIIDGGKRHARGAWLHDSQTLRGWVWHPTGRNSRTAKRGWCKSAVTGNAQCVRDMEEFEREVNSL